MDPLLAYKEACSQRGCKPLPEILQSLSSHVSPVLRSEFAGIRELRITGQTLGKAHLSVLSAGLQGNSSLSTLDLSNCHISSCESLFRSLSTSRSLETLDLSHNSYPPHRIDSEGVTGLSDLIEDTMTLRSIVLDDNLVEMCEVPIAVSRNETLTCFSIANNPMTFECLTGFLEALVSNKTLRYVGVAGCPQEGPAPIKENCNGLLSKKEAILIKLAHVLRYSVVSSISIDLDLSAEVQLQELESTLLKHNRALTSIRCPQIDWSKVKASGPLGGIYRAIRANQWLSQNEQLPRDQRAELGTDIEEVVAAKARRRGGESESSLSSSETFQRMFAGKYGRSNSPSLLHSCDSAAPVTASPDSKPPCPLQELEEADSKTLGVTAETPQFTPYASSHTFARKNQIKGKKSGDGEAVRTKSPVKDRRVMYESVDFELHTEPAPMHSSLDSRSPVKDPSNRSFRCPSPDLPTRLLTLEKRDQTLKRDIDDVTERLADVEEMGLRQREELLETQGRLIDTQKIVKDIRNDFQVTKEHAGRSKYDGSLSERMDAMERKEAAKVTLFEEIAKELDVRYTQSLKSMHTVSAAKIQTLESQLKDEKTKNDHLVRQQIERVSALERSVETIRGKVAQPADLTLISEQISLNRQEREEDREVFLSRIEALENRDCQIKEVKRYITVLQKDLSTKVKKLESSETTVRKLEARITVVEDTIAKYRDDSAVGSLQSYPNSPPISVRGENSRLNNGEAQLILRLEERVSDLEKELSSFSTLKKKLIDTLKRLKSLEQAMRSPRKHSQPADTASAKLEARKRIERMSPKSIRSTLTASKLMETVAYAGKDRQRTIATQPDEEIDTSFGVGEKEFRTERGLSDFLPGEAESVVMSALLERTRRPKPASTDLRYRSTSPLTSDPPKSAKHGPGPSADLKDYLRQKGFSIS